MKKMIYLVLCVFLGIGLRLIYLQVKIRITHPVGSVWRLDSGIMWFQERPFPDTLEVTGYDQGWIKYKAISEDPNLNGVEGIVSMDSRYIKVEKP